MTEVDDFYESVMKLSDLILTSKDISNYIWQSDYFRRFLILVSANYFETKVSEILESFANAKSGDPFLVSFLIRVTEKRYYQYFDWDSGKNANKFFSYFGDNFSDTARNEIKQNEYLKRSIEAFLEIGQTRNNLVHKQFLHFSLPKTVDEYYNLYKAALEFIEYLKRKLLN